MKSEDQGPDKFEPMKGLLLFAAVILVIVVSTNWWLHSFDVSIDTPPPVTIQGQ